MQPFRGYLLRWISAGGYTAVWCGILLAAAERGAVRATAESASAIGIPAWLTWAAALAACSALVVVTAGAAAAVRGLVEDRWSRPLVATAVGALLFGLIIALGAAPLGGDLASGGWISRQSWSWVVAYVPAALAFAGASIAWAMTAGAVGAAKRWRILVPAALLALVGLVTVFVDHRVLLGTYPDLHLFAWGAAVAMVTLGTFAAVLDHAVRYTTPRVAQTAGALLFAVALAGAIPWFASTMNVRAALTMGSPMAGNLVRATLPSVEFEFAERELTELDPNEGTFLRAGAPPLERSDWNVLWITVDTLRADALPPVRTRKTTYLRPGDTPFMDEWLATTTRFERAYAQSSATFRSMPPMFRSLEAQEDALKVGEPLGAAMAGTGRTSAAVVNNVFLEPRRAQTQSLLWGFELVTVHEKARQDLSVEQLRETIEATKDDGFFVWMHLYCMHAPGYDGKMLEGVSTKAAYRRSLRWLDAQMRGVIDVLEAQGLADDTIVIFSADHGEGLGDNRIRNHGPTVYEEEVRVPLAIRIPGVEPRQVPETVGNIDIVPTLWEALGLSPSPMHRGRSLLPAILGEPLEQHPYYVENHNGSKKAVVVATDKLIFDEKAGTFLRFDLAADPTEEENLFADSEADRPLLAALYRKNPELVKPTPVIGNLIAEKLAEVDPSAPGEALRYLVALAKRSESEAAAKELERIFRETPHQPVKLAILEGLDAKRTDVLISEYVATLGADEERTFVNGLADLAVAGVRRDVVQQRLAADDLPPENLLAWLRWLDRQEKPDYGDSLAKVAARVAAAPQAYSSSALATFASVLGKAELGGARDSLTKFNRGLLDHPSPRVRYEAVAAAAALDDRASLPRLRELTRSTQVRDRQATLNALAALEGAEAVDTIVALAEDPSLILDAIKALERTESEKALPFLQDVADNHFNWIIQNHAKSAIERID